MTEYTEYIEEDDVVGCTPEPAVLNFLWDLTLTTLLRLQSTFNNMANNFIIFKINVSRFNINNKRKHQQTYSINNSMDFYLRCKISRVTYYSHKQKIW